MVWTLHHSKMTRTNALCNRFRLRRVVKIHQVCLGKYVYFAKKYYKIILDAHLLDAEAATVADKISAALLKHKSQQKLIDRKTVCVVLKNSKNFEIFFRNGWIVAMSCRKMRKRSCSSQLLFPSSVWKYILVHCKMYDMYIKYFRPVKWSRRSKSSSFVWYSS